MQSLKRKTIMWEDAKRSVERDRQRAAAARTGQVVRSTVDVYGEPTPLDQMLEEASDTAALTSDQEDAIFVLDEDQASGLDRFLDGDGSDIEDVLDAGELGMENTESGADRWAEYDDSAADAHEAHMDGIAALVEVDEAKSNASAAADVAASALTTASGKNARRRGATEPEPPPGGWSQGDQWVVDNGEGVPFEVRVWNGEEFVPDQILADELLILGENGVIRLADGIVTAESIAADALHAKVINNGQFFGGYIEAPTIASSDKLGSGANLLDDPSFASTVNTAWVLSGHAGDAAVTQRDTITWDQTWTSKHLLEPTLYKHRNWGNVVADLTLTPGNRKPGSVVMANYAWLVKTARTFTNPYKFQSSAEWSPSIGQDGGWGDPTFKAVDSRAPGAATARTTYLTNSAVIPVETGQRWNLRLAYPRLTTITTKFVSALEIEILNNATNAVLFTYQTTEVERMAGQINAWWEPTFTGNVRYRIKATYTAGGGSRKRIATSASFARSSTDGVQKKEWLGSGSTNGIPYKSPPAAGTEFMSLFGTHGLEYQHRAGFTWVMQSAMFAQVQPSKGWRMTEQDGLELFNSLGARTARLDGEDNYFSGRLGTAESGRRLELNGSSLTAFDAYGNPVASIEEVGGQWKYSGDTEWVDIIIRPGFSAQSPGEVPQVMRRGNVLFLRGLFSSSGLSAGQSFTVGDIPNAFIPPRNMQIPAGTSSGAATAQIFLSATGTIQIRVGSVLSGYYGFGASSWPN